MLWRGEVIGWANLALTGGRLRADFGYAAGRAPRDAALRIARDAELERIERFLGLGA
jgi:hypothetical protein